MSKRCVSISIAVAMFLVAGCQDRISEDRTGEKWPASLIVIGDGFPEAGDACRVIGESAATRAFLDDSATLVGCRDAAAAARLGGRRLGEVDGVTLISVPIASGAGGQGDAMVAGTDYNAVAQVPCAGYRGAGPGLCEAGVNRSSESGPYVDVTLPDGTLRTLLFDGQGRFVTFSTAEADGTAAMEISSRRDGDRTIATIGTEQYEIPDAFVRGG